MSISKLYLKSKPQCKVTFTVPAKDANKVTVAGDFNNWNTEESQLRKLKNGTFKGTITLPKEQSFEFKYIIDGQWTNETEADRFQWNDYAASENSILEL